MFSRPLAAAAAIGWAAVAGMEWFHRDGVRRRSQAEGIGEARTAELSREIAAKTDYDDEKLTAEQRTFNDLGVHLLSEEAWAAFLQELGPDWSVASDRAEEGKDFSVQRVTLRLRSPSVGDWPIVVAAVKAAERRPGVRVVAVELESSGDQERRSMKEVKIVLSIGWSQRARERRGS